MRPHRVFAGGTAFIDTTDRTYSIHVDGGDTPPTIAGNFATPKACNYAGVLPSNMSAYANVDLSGAAFGILGAQPYSSVNCSGDPAPCLCAYPWGSYGTSPSSPSVCPAFNLWVAGGAANFYYSRSGQAVALYVNGDCSGAYPAGVAGSSTYGVSFLQLDGTVSAAMPVGPPAIRAGLVGAGRP